jgi:hypothetical protein
MRNNLFYLFYLYNILAKSMNAAIGFTSDEESGSSFWVELPICNESALETIHVTETEI